MAAFNKLAISLPAISVPFAKDFPHHSFWTTPESNDISPLPLMTPTNFPHLFSRMPTILECSIPIQDLPEDPVTSTPCPKDLPHHSFWTAPESNDIPPLPPMTPINFPHLFSRFPIPLERPIPTRDLPGDFHPFRLHHPQPSAPTRFIPTGAAPAPSPFKGLLELLAPTNCKNTIAAPIAEATAHPFRSAMTMFPWTTSTEQKTSIHQSGISIPDLSTKSHPPPVHRTIETNLLHGVWHHYATSPSAALFMEPSKPDTLAKADPTFTEPQNHPAAPKGITRSPTPSPSAVMTPKPSGGSKLAEALVECPLAVNHPGESPVINGMLIAVSKLQTALIAAQVSFSSLPKDTPHQHFEPRLKGWGFEKEWGDTAERVKIQ